MVRNRTTESVSVREVGLRDGLQMLSQQIPTATKLAWCHAQADAGFREIEVTSVVPPHILQQFSDAPDVFAAVQDRKGLLATILVPNLKGAEIAMEMGARKISYVLSASEAHNLSNVRRSVADSLNMFGDLLAMRKNRGLDGKLSVTACISTCFGCSIQGEVRQADVLGLVEALSEAGADEINIADTVGYANPFQVRQLITAAGRIAKSVPLAAHFHDTRGMGLANVTAALEAGVRRFDASLGGLGGCPFAPGATGNIATEDCVYLLEELGFDTGIDFEALLEVRKNLAHWLPNTPLEGRLSKAGPSRIFLESRSASSPVAKSFAN